MKPKTKFERTEASPIIAASIEAQKERAKRPTWTATIIVLCLMALAIALGLLEQRATTKGPMIKEIPVSIDASEIKSAYLERVPLTSAEELERLYFKQPPIWVLHLERTDKPEVQVISDPDSIKIIKAALEAKQ